MNASSVPTEPDAGTVFDVRPIPCKVKHAQIFQRWLDLPVGRYFVLVNDHDPIPLRYQFDAEYAGAFSWEYLLRGPDEFRVKITKTEARQKAPEKTAARPVSAQQRGSSREIDARGLTPPEPLIRILEALEELPPKTSLRAHTDREPCHLFGEAERRGFRWESKSQSDGSWVTILSRG